jgi:hypothetical protein
MENPLPSQTMAEKLRIRLEQEAIRMHDERLPGWEVFYEQNPKIGAWMNDLNNRIENSIRDEDEIRFEKELASIEKAWDRLNEIVAEDYRQKNADPELWELRFIKWMKISYIKFESPLGEFYLLPRTPSRKPKAKHWYTVDEMMVLIKPELASIVTLSGKLPPRPESLEPPGPGEQVIHIDATGPTVRTYYEMHKRGRYGRA